MTVITIGDKVVSQKLGEKLDRVSKEFMDLIVEVGYELYGEKDLTDEEYEEFFEGMMAAFIEAGYKCSIVN